MATDLLPHIQDDQISVDALAHFCNSLSISHLKIEYCVDTSAPSITVSVFLFGVRIGGGTLDPSHTSITVGGGVKGFKVEVKLEADFSQKRVIYEAKVCAPLVGCKHHKGTLFSW